MHVVIIVQRKSQLFQIVTALSAPGRLASLLYGWQQQGDQDRDDGNDNQQLNQRKAGGNSGSNA